MAGFVAAPFSRDAREVPTRVVIAEDEAIIRLDLKETLHAQETRPMKRRCVKVVLRFL